VFDIRDRLSGGFVLPSVFTTTSGTNNDIDNDAVDANTLASDSVAAADRGGVDTASSGKHDRRHDCNPATCASAWLSAASPSGRCIDSLSRLCCCRRHSANGRRRKPSPATVQPSPRHVVQPPPSQQSSSPADCDCGRGGVGNDEATLTGCRRRNVSNRRHHDLDSLRSRNGNCGTNCRRFLCVGCVVLAGICVALLGVVVGLLVVSPPVGSYTEHSQYIIIQHNS